MSKEKLHKMVDGVRVELAEDEEAEVLAEWAANEARQAAIAYIEARRSEYLPPVELIDALTKKTSKDPAVRAAGEAQEAAFHEHNLAVKARHPKP